MPSSAGGAPSGELDPRRDPRAALDELERLVAGLDREEAELEDLARLVEQAMGLLRGLEQRIAQGRGRLMVMDAEGRQRPFSGGPEVLE
jgi:exodeoxyribonuclease VII small subunit